MKIMLINPTKGMEDEYGALRRGAPTLPQLGLASVATVLSDNGHDVKIVDRNFESAPVSAIIEELAGQQFDLIGFSVYVTTHQSTLEFARRIKETIPNSRIIVGGPQVTLDPESCFSPNIDHLFIGEAEESILELINCISSNDGFNDLTGVLTRVNGKYVGHRQLRLIQDLDKVAFPDLVRFYDLDRFHPPVHLLGEKFVGVSSSRGCPYSCSFCAAASVNGRKVRAMDTKGFIDILEYHRKKGIDSYTFYDDTFTLNKERARDICRMIIDRKLNITWNCFSRVDRVDVETLALMRRAGCYLINFGCESFNEKTLKMLKKGFSPRQALEGIEIAKKAGLDVHASFMIGLPGETKDDINYTINKCVHSGLDFAYFPIFEPYRGTPLFEVCKETGSWKKIPGQTNLMLEEEAIWVPNGVSRGEIVALARKAMRVMMMRGQTLNYFLRLGTRIPTRRLFRIIRTGIDYFIVGNAMKSKRMLRVGSRFK